MRNKIKILLCEDDPNLGTLLTEYLNNKGYECDLATNGLEGGKMHKRNTYDLLVLDVMMPVKDGFTLAKEIRAEDKRTPIIFLTAKSMKEDTLEGFEAGADDYITKPFGMEVLLARIAAVLRRTNGLPDHETLLTDLHIGRYKLEYQKQKMTLDGKDIKLTTRENEMLYLLLKNKNGLLERTYILKTLWGEDSYFNGRSMDVYIAKIRKLLKDDTNIEIINIHGKGFKLVVTEG
ncbi:MAG: response regulator transcription factor [Flavobacteriales bacterium]